MVLLGAKGAFGCENDERSDLEVVGFADGPAVPAVGGGEPIEGEGPLARPMSEITDVDASVDRGGEQIARGGGHGSPGRADRGVLGPQQLFSLG